MFFQAFFQMKLVTRWPIFNCTGLNICQNVAPGLRNVFLKFLARISLKNHGKSLFFTLALRIFPWIFSRIPIQPGGPHLKDPGWRGYLFEIHCAITWRTRSINPTHGSSAWIRSLHPIHSSGSWICSIAPIHGSKPCQAQEQIARPRPTGTS